MTNLPKNAAVELAIDVAVDPNKVIRIARFFSYPKQVLYLIASFIILVSAWHFISLAYTYVTRNRVYSQRTSSASLGRLPVAIVDSFRALALRWTIPIGSSFTLNLAEVGMTLGYMGVLFSWTFVNTTTTTGVKVEPHYYANRAGTIAASQLPIMTALGMRNNLISWLTGISYDKLNYLHRMSARVLVVLVWIHAGGRVTIGLLADEALVNRWVQCGLLAATTLTMLCILTIRPVREKNYELFLIVHFLFAFVFLLSIYFHLTGRSLVYYGAWPSMVVWALDRVLRLLRLALFNFAYLNPWSKSSQDLDAFVEVLSPNFLKITLFRPKYFHWRPGQCAYLSFPTLSLFPFESHPFTISTIHNSESEATDNKLVFFLRVRKGFTARLKNRASNDETYKVFVNGPYSSPPILLGYQSVILIAGGSGVAFTLPLLLDLVRRAKRNEPACQRIVFVWAIRDANQIKWIQEPLLAALEQLPSSITVLVKLYITGQTPTIDNLSQRSEDNAHDIAVREKESSSSSSRFSFKLLELPFVSVEQGRPHLTAFVGDEIENAIGPLSVNVCGARTLASAVRAAIRVPRPVDVLRGGASVTLHVESFGGYVST